MRIHSTAAQPGPPVVVLVGGPGGSGSGTIASRMYAFLPLLEVGDLIVLDQRGTGQSTPSTIGSHLRVDLPLDRPGDRDAALALYLDRCRASRAWWEDAGADLAGYTTEESADDIDALRRTVGYERIRLLGFSYGSHLGLSVVRRHGETVASAVLGLVEGPDHTVQLPSQTQRHLDRLAGLAAVARELGRAVPDLVGMLASILDALRAAPAVCDARTRTDLAASCWARTTWPSPWPARSAGRRVSPCCRPRCARRVTATSQRSHRSCTTSAPGGSSVPCTTSWTSRRGRLRPVGRASGRKPGGTLLGDLANFPVAFTGEAWGVEPLPDAFRTPVVSDVPILLVSGTLDANTPPENAEEVLAGLRCGDHLVVDGMAHDYFMRFRRGDGHPVELVPTRRDRDPRGDETGAVHADGQAGADEVAVLTDGLAVGVVVPDKRAAANAS